MGHGTSHSAKELYTKLQEKMTALGYTNAFIGTVEGNPESTSLEAVVAAVKKAGYKKVVLRPMMVVAGDHANNDMAGEEDSWAAAFKTAGFDRIFSDHRSGRTERSTGHRSCTRKGCSEKSSCGKEQRLAS